MRDEQSSNALLRINIVKKIYLSPAVVEYGSIADCTFATPNNGAQKGPDGKWITTAPLGDGNYACGPTAGGPPGGGGKNYLVLQCDKFGEYSHS